MCNDEDTLERVLKAFGTGLNLWHLPCPHINQEIDVRVHHGGGFLSRRNREIGDARDPTPLVISCKPSNTVRQLKEMIARRLGWGQTELILMTNWPSYGVEMEEEKTLFEYGIRVSLLNEDCYLAAGMCNVSGTGNAQLDNVFKSQMKSSWLQ